MASASEQGVALLGEAGSQWQLQIGPNINTALNGYVNSGQAVCYVATQDPEDKNTYAKVSTDGGASWYPMPNNYEQSFAASGLIRYEVEVPEGTEIKFLMAITGAPVESGNWQYIIGPDIDQAANGVVNSTRASFLCGTPDSKNTNTYAKISTNGGGSWTPMPNNRWMPFTGSNLIQYALDVPQGASVKFTINLS